MKEVTWRTHPITLWCFVLVLGLLEGTWHTGTWHTGVAHGHRAHVHTGVALSVCLVLPVCGAWCCKLWGEH